MVAPNEGLGSSSSSLSSSSGSAEKPSSDARVAASRQNGRKSRGPKTAAGKGRSRMNALRHGLCASIVLLPGEDIVAFDDLANGIYETFRPSCQGEATLVDQYISIAWKLRRVADAEEQLQQLARTHQVLDAAAARRGSVMLAETLRQLAAARPGAKPMTPPEQEKHDAHLKEKLFLNPREWPQPHCAGRMLAKEIRKGEGPFLRLMDLEDRLRRMLGRTVREFKELRALRQQIRQETQDQPAFRRQPMEVYPFRRDGFCREQLEPDDETMYELKLKEEQEARERKDKEAAAAAVAPVAAEEGAAQCASEASSTNLQNEPKAESVTCDCSSETQVQREEEQSPPEPEVKMVEPPADPAA